MQKYRVLVVAGIPRSLDSTGIAEGPEWEVMHDGDHRGIVTQKENFRKGPAQFLPVLLGISKLDNNGHAGNLWRAEDFGFHMVHASWWLTSDNTIVIPRSLNKGRHCEKPGYK